MPHNEKGYSQVDEQKVISLEKRAVACQNCSLAPICLPMGLPPEDVERLDGIIRRNRPLHRGEHLFHLGDPFRSLFVIKTGSIKTYAPSLDGGEQILGFHLPGEMIGLDAIEEEQHHCSAKVLETSAVCELPFERLEALSSTIPSLQHQMYRLLSKEIGSETEMLLLLGKKSAEEKLANFLLSLSDRFSKRGFSATDFHLSMSRHEIGNYLGLAVETVSRLFSRFQDEGFLKVERKHIQLIDIDQLNIITNGQRSKVQEPNKQLH
jgi:CRP/FNR family transcriptional regulator